MTTFKLENIESHNWQGAIRGMRNPKKSWHLSDSYWNVTFNPVTYHDFNYVLGVNDLKLAKQLTRAGASHRKFLRQITVSFDITASLKFFDQFSTYEFVVSNSTSQMHDGFEKPFTQDDFCTNGHGVDQSFIDGLNTLREAYLYNKTIDNYELLLDHIPQSFSYTRTITMNYEVFIAMWFQRNNHKKFEWRLMCEQLRKELPYMDDLLSALETKKGETKCEILLENKTNTG